MFFERLFKVSVMIVAAAILVYVIAEVRVYAEHRLIPPIELVGPPYLHLGDGVQNQKSIFHPGQALYLRAFTKRIVACTVTISYSILEMSDMADGTKYRLFWYFPRSASAATGVGTFITDERRLIPGWIPPGEYFFTRFAQYDCDGLKIEQKTPPIPFTLIGPVMHEEGSS